MNGCDTLLGMHLTLLRLNRITEEQFRDWAEDNGIDNFHIDGYINITKAIGETPWIP